MSNFTLFVWGSLKQDVHPEKWNYLIPSPLPGLWHHSHCECALLCPLLGDMTIPTPTFPSHQTSLTTDDPSFEFQCCNRTKLKIPCQKVVDLLIVRHLPEIGIYLNLVVKLLVKQLQLVPILADLKRATRGRQKTWLWRVWHVWWDERVSRKCFWSKICIWRNFYRFKTNWK